MRDDDHLMVDNERQPTGEERKSVTKLAAKLRHVRYPALGMTTKRHELPPGRVDVQEAMRGYQQSKQGQVVTARPFLATARDRTPHTPLTVGIMCDISGSMSALMEPVAVTRWVLANALLSVQGIVATTLFGDRGHGVQKPREEQRTVKVYHANGGWENFTEGFSMLDSVLNLIDGDGARLLVIITDGHFVGEDEVTYAEQIMDMCRMSGCGVLWVCGSDYFARDDNYGYGSRISTEGKTTAQVADAMGDAVVEEFARVIAHKR